MTISTLGALAVSLAQCAAPGKALPPDLASLVDAERAFADASFEKGTRAAFIQYLADDAIVFRAAPVPGKKWYASKPSSSGILVWETEYAHVSSSNDLGYTTGPWMLREDSTGEASGFGHYVSVWRRGADREWEVAISVGIAHGRVERPKAIATPPSEKLEAGVTQQEALAAIQQEERDFVDAASRGIEDAFDAFGAEDIRVYRSGDVPGLGKEQARALLLKQPGTRQMQTTAAEASRDGDVCFTYGRCDTTHNEQVSTSYYLRIWKRLPDGSWKIALDLNSPASSD